MSIRIVTVPLFDRETDDVALAAAFDIARRFEVHLVGLFARPGPAEVVPVVGEGLTGRVIDDLTRAAETVIDRRRDGARARFEAARTAAGAAIADAPPGPGAVSARWREVMGRRERAIPEAVRLADLVVFARDRGDPEGALRTAFEATLLGSGRPLLLVPPAAPAPIGHAIAVAWNGSAEAARALAGAMPFLERAGRVHLLTAATWRTAADAGVALAEYLEWYRLPYERQVVEVRGEPVGAALLRAAGEAGADLLVMGGYGRARLSELVLGGVTRHVLTHAHVAVLMAHRGSPMPLKRIRLELARGPEHPGGSPDHGYEFIAPLTADGHLDVDAWRGGESSRCRVRRFWRGEADEHGRLVHHRGGRWAFHYDDAPEPGEEPIFRFGQHRFVEGEYASVTEHDGVQRTFRVASVRDEE